MIIDPFRFVIPVVNAGWNPDDKSAHVTLSGSNRTMESDGTLGSVRAITSRAAGVLYFEVTTDSSYNSGETSNIIVGICDDAMSLTVNPQWGAPSGKYVGAMGNSFYCNDATGSLGTHAGSGWAPTNGVHTAGFVITFATRTVEFFDNGTSRFSTTWSAGPSEMFPFATGTNGGGLSRLVLRTMASEFLQSIPVGATAWDS